MPAKVATEAEKMEVDGGEEERVEALKAGLGLGRSAMRPVDEVVMHPLVLLSVVDHFHRVSKTSKVSRVVGVLLGSVKAGRRLDVSNSFAVPFDEDPKDPDVWFLDHDYLANMYNMFRKVAAKEKIVGWYHTGPRLRPNDMAINEKMKSFCPEPVVVIVEPEPRALGLPCSAYWESWQSSEDGRKAEKTMEHLPTSMGAEEAEEVGVEHLLRDLKDQTAGTLSQQIHNQVDGLKGLNSQLEAILRYLKQVQDGALPPNHQILRILQDVLNLIPDSARGDLSRAANQESNDQMLAIFMGALSRSLIALHDLINNKLALRNLEKAPEKPPAKDKDAKDKDKDAKDKKDAKEDDKDAKDGKDKAKKDAPKFPSK